MGQEDFSAGTLLGIAQDHEIGVGVEQMLNGIVDDAGDIVRRGPARRIGTSFGAPLTFSWSGYLGINYVRLVATAARMFAVNPDLTHVDLGAPGLPEPVLPAIVGNLLFLPNGSVWGGATKASYGTGSISGTTGSTTILGAGTGWSAANVEAGMILTSVAARPYVVKSLTDATHLTLTEPLDLAIPGGSPYTLARTATDALPATNRVRHLGAVANRLVVATDNIVAFTPPGKPFTFNATDFHQLPDGVVVKGLWTIRDQLLLFTNYGVWAITNMAFDLTDDFGNPQQTLSRLTPEVSLLHEAGLAEWIGTVVAPCVDRVYLLDGISTPIPISDSISSLYMSYMRDLAYQPGGAKVFRGGYFLPILNAAKNPVALLSCRLNRPVRSQQVWYPWSQYAGLPVGISALDVDLRGVPSLTAVHNSGWQLDMNSTMPPFDEEDDTLGFDVAGGNIPILFDVQTRDLPTGDQRQPNHFRRLRFWYDNRGDGDIKAAYSFGMLAQRYQDITRSGRIYGVPIPPNGSTGTVLNDYPNYASMYRGESVDPEDIKWSQGMRFWNVLDAKPLEEPGLQPLLWMLDAVERARYVRVRFRSEDGVPQIKLRKVDVAVRPTNHTR